MALLVIVLVLFAATLGSLGIFVVVLKARELGIDP
jgi:hypothetical protein